jgi:enamine deaminase RidA (YjgF/YER057c/UK114 family)
MLDGFVHSAQLCQHDLCLGVYAVQTGSPPERTVMTSHTLNEAMVYGADFVRGMKMVETNKIALHVSGTASIDEAGRTAHVGDFEGQADRMLLNVAALLEGQGATFRDVVSAVTYLKRPADAGRLRENTAKPVSRDSPMRWSRRRSAGPSCSAKSKRLPFCLPRAGR